DLDRDKPIKALTWNYADKEANKRWGEPSARLILKEINGYKWTGKPLEGEPLSSFAQLEADGSTACGAWIYTGVYTPPTKEDLAKAKQEGKPPPAGHNHAADRTGDKWVALGWGFSWPANRRLMYNRASADLKGNPWPKEVRLANTFARPEDFIYWDPAKKA